MFPSEEPQTVTAPRSSLGARKREVPSDFDAVAPTYDFLTGANPGYHAHLRLSARRLDAPPGARLLDLCCGTGASTDALLRAYPDADVVGLDASEGMLTVAREKPSLRGVRFVHGDAASPADAGVEGPFDGILMAYGIRNLPEPDAALANLHALLRPGGRIVFHEYSVADSLLARGIWDLVCYGVIIPGGLLTARSTRIYRYLHQSVCEFDGVRAFEARLRAAGFTDVWTGPMDGWQRGIVHSFVARRPA
jgi:ubiquinone/menaquinone biosynthesis C-methylase UbiE